MAAGQLIKRGDDKWLIRIYLGEVAGKRRYWNKTVNGGKRHAEKILAKELAARDRGELAPRSRDTFDAFLDTWLEGLTVRPQTADAYTYTLKQYVRPHLGAARLRDVSALALRALYARLGKQGLSPRTVRSVHEVLRNALEGAVDAKLLTANPAATRTVRMAIPKRVRTERTVVEGGDALSAFLDAAHADEHTVYWLLLLFGGLRPSEALALRWADLSGDRVQIRRVLVDRTGKSETLHFAEPKSETSRRSVTLPAVVLDALKDHRKVQAADRLKAGAEWQDGDLILCDARGGPLRQGALRRRFARLLKDAELPAMRVYDLRHSMATLLLDAGVPLKVVSERLGHSGIALTADTYSHVTQGMQGQAADALAAAADAAKHA
jgi:integrase